MVAAVSADISQGHEAASPAEYHWFKMPDLNRATHRRLGQSGAGWTFETIRRLVHHVGRVGRPKAKKAARELGRLGVGLQAIADEAGVSVAKVRRDLVKLVDIGLVAVSRRNVTFGTDPATGRIIENRTGRSMPVVVFLTIGPEHCRTKAGQERPAANHPRMAPANPATVIGPGPHDRDHSGGAIQRDFNSERTPDGDAVGIGTPPAVPGGRLPAAKAPGHEAGKAGGHTAAKASQEKVIDEDDGPVPVGRICRPAGKAAQKRHHYPEDHDIESRVWSGAADEARRRMLRQMEEQRRRDEEVFKAEQAAGTLTPRQRVALARTTGKAVNQ